MKKSLYKTNINKIYCYWLHTYFNTKINLIFLKKYAMTFYV